MLPADILTVRDIGDTTHPYWTAASPDGAHLVLEPAETVLWAGLCEVSQRQPTRWELPGAATLVVTDRRSAFLTTRYDTGGGWAGFGVVGLAVAVTANAVSHHRAAARSAGTVAIGQARHEWLTELGTRHNRGLFGGLDTFLDLTVACSTGPRVLVLHSPAALQDSFAAWLAGLVAWQRLTLGVPRTPEEHSRLERYRTPGPEPAPPQDQHWYFPGDPDALATAALRTLAPGG